MPPKRRGETQVTTEERVNSSPPTCFQSSSPSSCEPALGPQINLTRQKSYSFEGSSFHQLQPICNSNSSNQLSALPFSHRINLSTSIPGPSIGAMPMEEDICLDAAGLSTQIPSGSQIECATPNRELSYLILCEGLALEILTRYPTMACERDENNDGKTALHVLAQKATDIAGGSLLKIVARYTSLYFKNFYKQASMPILDRDLIERIWEQVLQRSDEEISDLIRRPSGVLFDAALSGNVEFLALLLCKYPDLLWEVNEKEQSVFHVAVMHRHVHVFNLIYNIGAAKDYIVGNVDVDKNNMLHLAGMLPLAERLGAPRANLQMQRELLWFKEVEEIVRPFHMYMKNSEEMTPIDVFNKDHKDLLKLGEEAMKETANSCMLVATLISTVVFAAALTLPGASNKISNTPFFHKEQWFMIFILSNAVALFTSAASIVLLLSILTSSYAQSEFVYSLHARLMFGLTTLFISITTMVSAFIAAIFLIFDYKLEWVPYVIASLARAPVILFLVLHSNLWADLIRSYYWSKFLFRPSKQRIFELEF
ncbi:ankyrin repeat-containing protein ITN1-like isoform X4 [Quercus lobata]|uniref:ankyrin repeat-containing protein ITN1-like isoform X4 n=1 Tax=Quercus lobata TaxID=97700 RepID=UPI00124832A6|nr:ankyrin repeat-containing protein ITN1-like isoform X4 [Quercus lobata]